MKPGAGNVTTLSLIRSTTKRNLLMPQAVFGTGRVCVTAAMLPPGRARNLPHRSSSRLSSDRKQTYCHSWQGSRSWPYWP